MFLEKGGSGLNNLSYRFVCFRHGTFACLSSIPSSCILSAQNAFQFFVDAHFNVLIAESVDQL